jgi:hypothetical protein
MRADLSRVDRRHFLKNYDRGFLVRAILLNQKIKRRFWRGGAAKQRVKSRV